MKSVERTQVTVTLNNPPTDEPTHRKELASGTFFRFLKKEFYHDQTIRMQLPDGNYMRFEHGLATVDKAGPDWHVEVIPHIEIKEIQ